MLKVTRKNDREALENMLRRFNKKVQQSGVLSDARSNQFHEKEPTKRDRREKAIIRKERKEAKIKRIRLGR